MQKQATTAEVLAEIGRLNRNPDVFGILLQHPVPRQVDERSCFDEIAVAKDVDGVTSHGFGRMALGEAAFGSATPAGIMRLLAHYGIPLAGKEAVVVGRSVNDHGAVGDPRSADKPGPPARPKTSSPRCTAEARSRVFE